MLKPSVGVALEGLPYIIISAFTTLIFALIDCWPMAIIGLGLTCFIGHFFRDPERVGPENAEAVCSPADGKVIKVTRETDPVSGEERQVIAIFMNVFNVHVNRMPVSGKVEVIRYIPGKFLMLPLTKQAKTTNVTSWLLPARVINGSPWCKLLVSLPDALSAGLSPVISLSAVNGMV